MSTEDRLNPLFLLNSQILEEEIIFTTKIVFPLSSPPDTLEKKTIAFRKLTPCPR